MIYGIRTVARFEVGVSHTWLISLSVWHVSCVCPFVLSVWSFCAVCLSDLIVWAALSACSACLICLFDLTMWSVCVTCLCGFLAPSFCYVRAWPALSASSAWPACRNCLRNLFSCSVCIARLSDLSAKGVGPPPPSATCWVYLILARIGDGAHLDCWLLKNSVLVALQCYNDCSFRLDLYRKSLIKYKTERHTSFLGRFSLNVLIFVASLSVVG